MIEDESDGLLDVEAVEKALGRSRASIYRYANTSTEEVNLSYDPQKLNPELRRERTDPLQFHPTEVARFARDILKMKPVVIEVQEPTVSITHRLLGEILTELRLIREDLSHRS